MKIIKNIGLIIAFLIFIGGIFGAAVWQTSAQSASQNFKLTPIVNEEAGSVQGQATEAAKKEVDYFLVYPGILPDHFLYPIKMIRDKILLFLTTDPLKKAELYLLFADKRLGACKALIEGNKIDLGITTLTKAEKYLELAINQERIAKKADKDTVLFLEKLSKATLKHEEIILSLEKKIPDTGRPAYDSALQYARQGYQRVIEILKK